MRIPRGELKHPELSEDGRPVIVRGPTYFGARAEPPPARPGWVWRQFMPCEGCRLEPEGATSAYEPDDFMTVDKAAMRDALKDVAKAK